MCLEHGLGGEQTVRPFLFLALTVPPGHVDVNMHPAKKQASASAAVAENYETQ